MNSHNLLIDTMEILQGISQMDHEINIWLLNQKNYVFFSFLMFPPPQNVYICTLFIGASSKSSLIEDIIPWTLSLGIAKPMSKYTCT